MCSLQHGDMTYEEAISLAKEGYRIGRECWGDAYISIRPNSTSKELVYYRSELFGDTILTTCNNYYASQSDRNATDWREVIR